MAEQEWERYFTKRRGNVSTAWPSFTDFPTNRECCLGNSRVTLVGLIIAIFGVAFMFGGHPVIAVMLLLLAWVLVMLDEDMRSG